MIFRLILYICTSQAPCPAPLPVLDEPAYEVMMGCLVDAQQRAAEYERTHPGARVVRFACTDDRHALMLVQQDA